MCSVFSNTSYLTQKLGPEAAFNSIYRNRNRNWKWNIVITEIVTKKKKNRALKYIRPYVFFIKTFLVSSNDQSFPCFLKNIC